MDTDTSAHPDLRQLEIPIDTWTRPFWEAAALQRLVLPCCADCHQFRWPPGPFCPACRSQRVEWQSAGCGRIYSFTIVPPSRTGDAAPVSRPVVPALIEFPEAAGIRLLAAIVDTPVSSIHIGARVEPHWSEAANATVPVFKVRGTPGDR
jgi:uncharacterized OB-fold protein